MTDFNDFIATAGAPSGTVKVPGVVDGSTPTKGFDVTLAAQALLDDANTAAQLGTLGPLNTASSSGGASVPIDLGNKAGLILTLTGNVTTFALPTNGPAGTSQETEHMLRVVASGATRTIATGAFAFFDLGGSVAPASGYSISDGAFKDFALHRVHNGTAEVWFVDLLIPGTDVANTPAGNIAATTVQAAINELDTEKQPLDATLTALAGMDTVAGAVYQSGADTFTKRAFTDTASVTWDLSTANQIKATASGGGYSAVAAMPSSGSYTAGDFVPFNAPVPKYGPGKPALTGWRRLTTGSNHVLNTDWVEEWVATKSPVKTAILWEDFMPSTDYGATGLMCATPVEYNLRTTGVLTCPGSETDALGTVKLVGPTGGADGAYIRIGRQPTGFGIISDLEQFNEIAFRVKGGTSGTGEISWQLSNNNFGAYVGFKVTNQGNLFAWWNNNGTPGTQDTGVASTDWHTCAIRRTSTPSYLFYVDGTLVHTQTTNIPATGVSDRYFFQINVGYNASPPTAYTDFLYVEAESSANRS